MNGLNGWQKGLMLVFLLVVAIMMIKGKDTATSAATENNEIAAACKTRIDAEKVLASWDHAIEFIRRMEDNTAVVHVWTDKWKQAGHKAHVSIAVSAYCTVMDQAGNGVVIVKGNSGEKLGGVVDGQYLD